MRQEPSEFDARIAAYWHARYPRNASKELQRQFGISEAKADRALRGEVSKDFLYAMMKAEGWRFTAFITQPAGAVDAALPIAPRAMIGAQHDQALWFDDEGALHAAPEGHALSVCRRLGLDARAADGAAYAIRNLGYIEALARTDGTVRLRHSQTITPAAADRCSDWLSREAQGARVIEIVEWADGSWETSRRSLSDAIHHFERASAISSARCRLPERSWRVERLPLASVTPTLIGLLRTESPLDFASKSGLLATSSYYLHRDDGIMCCHIGSGLDLPISSYVGRDVLDRDDADYAALLHRRLCEAANSNEPTFYSLDIEIDKRRRRYESLARRDPARPGIIITSSIVHPDVEGAAA